MDFDLLKSLFTYPRCPMIFVVNVVFSMMISMPPYTITCFRPILLNSAQRGLSDSNFGVYACYHLTNMVNTFHPCIICICLGVNCTIKIEFHIMLWWWWCSDFPLKMGGPYCSEISVCQLLFMHFYGLLYAGNYMDRIMVVVLKFELLIF